MTDVSGKLRIWDTTQKEHLLKYEYQPFAGKIKDIAWTEDSKRIAVVGEGREKWGGFFVCFVRMQFMVYFQFLMKKNFMLH